MTTTATNTAPAMQPALEAPSALLDEVVGRTKYSEQDRDLIRRTLCKDASADEFEMFMKYCERTGLDPFARQLYLVKRKGRVTIQTGIDGYRLLADRTGRYAGNDAPVYSGAGHFGTGSPYPETATVTVWKIVAGERRGFSATARWHEYYPGDGAEGFMWKKMPYLMLGKVAEALALRKAFPADLSGIYTDTEMQQAAADDEAATKPCSVKQARRMNELREALGWQPSEVTALIKGCGYNRWQEMPADKADEIILHMEQLLAEQASDPLAETPREPGQDDQGD